MKDKLALKRLTASDLTFFEWHFRNRNAGNQKAINLNADVFKERFYPLLNSFFRNRQNKIGIDLWVSGPAATEPMNLQRKIIKGRTYKNWRLDGELIYNPKEQPERFNILEAGDIALFAFDGEPELDTVTLVLVAHEAEADKTLFDKLDGVLLGQRMMAISADRLRVLCEENPPVSDIHPVWRLMSDADIAEAGFVEVGLELAPAMERLVKSPRPMALSRDEFREIKERGEEIGRVGEELVDFYLSSRGQEGEISEHEWVSDKNAISPYDFLIRYKGKWGNLEVKSTTRNFGREYSLSRGELQEMASGDEFYRIARVYEITAEGAKMRISGDMCEFGKAIVEGSRNLPPGVKLDKAAITPDESMFSGEIVLSVPDSDEE